MKVKKALDRMNSGQRLRFADPGDIEAVKIIGLYREVMARRTSDSMPTPQQAAYREALLDCNLEELRQHAGR